MESFELEPSPIERPKREMGIEELKEELEYLKQQIGIDPLTGAHTAPVFERELEQSLRIIRGEVESKRAGEKTPKVQLISIDIDKFKDVNDTFGHQAGDEVLKKVVGILRSSVRSGDIVARLGGGADELFVLLQNANEEVALRKAEEFRAKIENLTFDADANLKVTASFGVVSSESSTDATLLKKFADDALYNAKKAGRNQVMVYKEGENESLPTTGE